MPNPFYATITFIPRPDSIERRLRMLRTKKAPPSKRKTIAARLFIVNPASSSCLKQFGNDLSKLPAEALVNSS
jgi:hypothetical protein